MANEWSVKDAWDAARAADTPSVEILPHTDYQRDPIRWAVDKLGIPEQTLRWTLNAGYDAHLWDGTPEPMVAFFEGLAWWDREGMAGGGGVCVEAATGVGKSFSGAIIVLWFLACHEDGQVYTFAPKEDQLRLYIWKTVTELWPRFVAWFPSAVLTDLRIQMRGQGDDTWSAHGFPVQVRAGESVSIRASGMHAEHLLLMYEEMPGIEQSVVVAGKNTCTAPHNIRVGLGNPSHMLDALHRMGEESGVRAIRMSALDHPNVVANNHSLIPGAVSRVSIAKRKADYGETDPVYQSRVRGVSPEQASNALIRLEWLKRSAARYDARVLAGTIPTRVTGKGVDVANSEHGDRSCIVDFAENVVVRIDARQCPDANLLGAQVVREARLVGLDPRRVGVDAIGVGAGTVNEARRLGFVLNALYAGGKPMVMAEKMPDGKTREWSPDVNRFVNLRAQMYWQIREDYRLDRIDVPEKKSLWDELVAPTFEDDNNVVWVEPKDDIKDRLGRSPDEADALAMANWVRSRILPEQVVPEVPVGQSLGLDWKTQKPKQRLTADQEMQKLLGRPAPPTAGRNRVPIRSGRR